MHGLGGVVCECVYNMWICALCVHLPGIQWCRLQVVILVGTCHYDSFSQTNYAINIQTQLNRVLGNEILDNKLIMKLTNSI